MSNSGAKEANHYADIDRDESRALSFSKMCDRALDSMTWQQLEEAMASAPLAQRKEFWTQLIGFLEVEAKFIAKQNVSLIAAPLQEAVALAVDAMVRKEIGE